MNTMAQLPNITTVADFNTFLETCGSAVAVLHFSAPWSEACRQMNEVMTELSKNSEYPNVKFCQVEAESVPKISELYEIKAVPAFIFLHNSKVIDRIEGAYAADLTKKVRNYNNNPPSDTFSPDAKTSTNSAHGTSENAKEALNDSLKKLVNSYPCMVFMKGTPEMPRCGFSKQLIDILNKQNADFKTFDISSDETVRQGLKELSNWPTYPQVYVNGELIGGLDVVKESIEAGELKIPKMRPKLDEKLKSLISKAPIMVFMKGNAEVPRCGFSKTLVQILNNTGAKYETFDILQDEEVRQGLKEYSNWPTYPQVYVNGNLIGGLDIIEEMQQSGELEEALKVEKTVTVAVGDKTSFWN